MLTCTVNGWTILWTKGRIPSKRPPPTFLRNLCLRGRGGGWALTRYFTVLLLFVVYESGVLSSLVPAFYFVISIPLRSKKNYMPESEQRGAVLEKIRKCSKVNNSPFLLKTKNKNKKKQVMDQCILPTMTYGCQTWSLNKQTTNKLRTAQRAMERKMLDLKLKDKIPCSEIRKRTKIIDIIEYTLKQKWKWAGHIARLEDNRWTKRCTEWQPRRGKRSRGRPSRRWQDDITEKEGTTWIRKATDRRQWKTLMEGYILQWMDKA